LSRIDQIMIILVVSVASRQRCSLNIYHSSAFFGWRRGVVVSGVPRMNEVLRTSGPVSTWMGDLRVGIPSRYVTSHLGQLSLASLRGRLIESALAGVRAGMSPLPGGR